MTYYQFGPGMRRFNTIDEARAWYGRTQKNGTKADLWANDTHKVGTVMKQNGITYYLRCGKKTIREVRKNGSVRY